CTSFQLSFGCLATERLPYSCEFFRIYRETLFAFFVRAVDPVEVTGSSIQLSYADGDIWDWAVDWDTWVSMSALPPPAAKPAATQIPVTAPVTPSDAPTPSGTPTTTNGPGG
ncbi:hypothetical protein ABLN64_05685, partial [Mycobacterium tuberculosis]